MLYKNFFVISIISIDIRLSEMQIFFECVYS